MEAREAVVGAVYVAFVYVSIFYFWNLGFGFWIYLAVFVSGFGFLFQCPTHLQRAKLTNFELVLVCVYLVRTAFDLRVCGSDEFGF
jgi:hypothetical protein